MTYNKDTCTPSIVGVSLSYFCQYFQRANTYNSTFLFKLHFMGLISRILITLLIKCLKDRDGGLKVALIKGKCAILDLELKGS